MKGLSNASDRQKKHKLKLGRLVYPDVGWVRLTPMPEVVQTPGNRPLFRKIVAVGRILIGPNPGARFRFQSFIFIGH
jgi:hypothetical protein